MDIFEIAQQGMKIQEEELRELAQEEEEKKPYKLDIKEALEAASRKDYDWFNRLGENQKSFQPFMLNMWMGMIWTKNTTRAFKGNDNFYASIIRNVNSKLNTHVFYSPKELFWLLSCTIQEYINYELDKKGNKRISSLLDYDIVWIKSEKKNAGEKYNKKVINYMASELYSSTEKIMDMIDNGLITPEDMTAIEADLETIEEKKK
jgi:hypothetical protein